MSPMVFRNIKKKRREECELLEFARSQGIRMVPAVLTEGYMNIAGEKVNSDVAYYEGDSTIYYAGGRPLSVGKLRHELGHAIQQKRFPDMGIEERELDSFLLEVKIPKSLNLEIVQHLMISQVARASLIYYQLRGIKDYPWDFDDM